MPPPDGVVPDFSLTRTSVQQEFILTYAITLGIAIVLVLLRLYTRLFLLKSFGLDDCRCRTLECPAYFGSSNETSQGLLLHLL